MAWQELIARLRRWPWFHRILRAVYRLLTQGLPRVALDTWRRLLPPAVPGSLPRGTFSLLAWPQQSSSAPEGRLVVTDQGAPTVMPSSIMVRCGLRQHLEQPWPIFWCRQRQARLVGKSLVPRNRQGQLAAEALYGAHRVADDPAYWHLLRPAPHRLPGNWTSVISRWVPSEGRQVYAHWLFDALPRLAVLDEFPPDTRILIPASPTRYMTESLALLGLEQRCRPTRERDLVVDDYYFSSPTAMIVCYNPYAVSFLRRRFLPVTAPDGGEGPRVFIRRSGLFRGAADNAQLERFFQERGWQVCDPAALGFAEQVRVFAAATAVAGIHGAGFANCVWCKPGTRILELFCDQFLSGCYEWLAQVVRAEYRALVFPTDEKVCAKVDFEALKHGLRELRL